MMEFYLTTLFLALIGIPIIFFSFKQIDWILNKEKYIEQFNIIKKFEQEGRKVIFINKISREEIEKRISKEGSKIVMPGFFGPSKRFFFYNVKFIYEQGKEKIYIVKATQSLFSSDKIEILNFLN